MPAIHLNKTHPQHPIAPLALSLCWGFAVVNILLGIGIAALYRTTVPLAVANILTYQQWGVIFFLLGLTGSFALLTRRYRLVRQAQLWSVFVKTIWLLALIIRCIFMPQTITITLVWLFFTYVQIMVYVHFESLSALGVKNGSK
jgi:Ca2+/Na+ antiporter